MRTADVVCRYGGEEFVLILPDATAEDSLRRIEQLRLATAQLYVKHREQYRSSQGRTGDEPLDAPSF